MDFDTVDEFMELTKKKRVYMSDTRKMPDAPPAHWAGVGTVVSLLGVALGSDSEWVQLGAVIGATAIGVALCYRDAVVRRYRHETEQSRYSNVELVLDEEFGAQGDGEEA